jgi:tetratricopeptide (TPR) repeat protein
VLCLAATLAAGCTPAREGYLRIDAPLLANEATAARASALAAATVEDHAAALASWRRLIRGGHQDYEACWRGARAASAVVLAMDPGAEGRPDRAREAVAWAERAVERDPERVEGSFAYALALGLLAECSSLEAEPAAILAASERVVALDAAYEYAGGHRLSGLFLLRAPDLYGGDLDLALDHLQTAVKIAPRFTENQLALAEAWLEDGDADGARVALATAAKLPRDARLDGWLAELRERLAE